MKPVIPIEKKDIRTSRMSKAETTCKQEPMMTFVQKQCTWMTTRELFELGARVIRRTIINQHYLIISETLRLKRIKRFFDELPNVVCIYDDTKQGIHSTPPRHLWKNTPLTSVAFRPIKDGIGHRADTLCGSGFQIRRMNRSRRHIVLLLQTIIVDVVKAQQPEVPD